MLAAELYAVASGFDMEFSFAHTFAQILGRKLKLRVFTDSRTLFDSIITFCTMTEKRLLIDIAFIRQSYREGELEDLGWIRSDDNAADALTKDKVDIALHRILRTHKVKVNVQQWTEHGRIPAESMSKRS